MKKALLSLGSNMGDRRQLLADALCAIERLPDTRVTKLSNLYETSPWGGVEQDDFLNLCAEIETKFAPEQLLTELQKIELDAGRTREVRWGPRTLDIDIIIYEGVNCDTERLTLPHPRFMQRSFVLRPMADIYRNFNALGVSFSLTDGDGEVREAGELTERTK